MKEKEILPIVMDEILDTIRGTTSNDAIRYPGCASMRTTYIAPSPKVEETTWCRTSACGIPCEVLITSGTIFLSIP